MGETRKFNIGDRVVGIKKYDGLDLKGQTGTVVYKGQYNYGVQWDSRFGCRLHNLGGKLKEPIGWFCPASALAPLDDTEYENAPDVLGLL